MKGKTVKRAAVLPLAALAACFAFLLPAVPRGASAMPESVSAEIAQGGVWFPKLTDLGEGETYVIDLFEKGDTAYETRLNEEGKAFYAFGDVGEYLLRYTVYDGELAKREHSVPFTVVDTTAPEMAFSADYENVYAAGSTVEILLPALTDNNPAGAPEVSVSVSVNGGEKQPAEGSVTLGVAGTYALEYTATDKSGNSVTRVFSFVTGEVDLNDTEKPVITVGGAYPETAKAGGELEIFSASVSDNSGENIAAEVAVFANGEILPVENGKVKLPKEGRVTVRYSAADSAGNAASVTFEIEIVASGCGCGGSVAGAGAAGALLSAAAGGVWLALKKRGAQGRNEK